MSEHEHVVIIDGVRYVPETATKVSIHGMYDCHLFHRVTGSTVDEIIEKWRKHNSEKHPALVDGHEVDDLGPSYLCPAIVLSNDRELRRVGQMVFRDEQVESYRQALLADPDIPRLLATQRVSTTRR